MSEIHGGNMGSIEFSADVVDVSDHVHHLPCCIKHTGPADVSQYFKPKKAGMEVDDLVVEEAAFRGRKLFGTTVPIPEGYSGFVIGKKRLQATKRASTMGKSSEAADGDSNDWEVLAKSQNLTVWNHDTVPNKDDAFLRSLHWLSVASALHKPVTADDLAAEKLK